MAGVNYKKNVVTRTQKSTATGEQRHSKNQQAKADRKQAAKGQTVIQRVSTTKAPGAAPNPQQTPAAKTVSAPRLTSAPSSGNSSIDTIIACTIIMVTVTVIKDVNDKGFKMKPVIGGFMLGTALMALSFVSAPIAKGLAVLGVIGSLTTNGTTAFDLLGGAAKSVGTDPPKAKADATPKNGTVSADGKTVTVVDSTGKAQQVPNTTGNFNQGTKGKVRGNLP